MTAAQEAEAGLGDAAARQRAERERQVRLCCMFCQSNLLFDISVQYTNQCKHIAMRWALLLLQLHTIFCFNTGGADA